MVSLALCTVSQSKGKLISPPQCDWGGRDGARSLPNRWFVLIALPTSAIYWGGWYHSIKAKVTVQDLLYLHPWCVSYLQYFPSAHQYQLTNQCHPKSLFICNIKKNIWPWTVSYSSQCAGLHRKGRDLWLCRQLWRRHRWRKLRRIHEDKLWGQKYILMKISLQSNYNLGQGVAQLSWWQWWCLLLTMSKAKAT